MANKSPNRVRMSVTGTPGTGDVALNVATSGYQTLANGGVSNGDTFSYVIEDGANWECGVGTYNSSGPSFARTTVRASSGGGTSKITASSSAVVYASILGEDLGGSFSGAYTDLTGEPTSASWNMSGLGDASFGTLDGTADGKVVYWNNTAGKFELKTVSGGGGGPGGTAPAVVQFKASSVNGAIPSVTMDAAPTAGNLLIAHVLSDSTDPTTGSGWTKISSATAGTYYNYMYYKIAGASESTTQSPVTGSGTNHCSVGIWEVSGQNGTTPVLTASSVNTLPTDLFLTTPVLPAIGSTLYLAALVSYTISNDLSNALIATPDGNLNGGAGARPCYGHLDSSSVIYSMAATQGSPTQFDCAYAIITH